MEVSVLLGKLEKEMNLPGLDNTKVIESRPMVIYEGCSEPGKIPMIIRLIKWLLKK